MGHICNIVIVILKLYRTLTEDRRYRSSAAFFFATYTKGSQTKAGWHCAAKTDWLYQ